MVIDFSCSIDISACRRYEIDTTSLGD